MEKLYTLKMTMMITLIFMIVTQGFTQTNWEYVSPIPTPRAFCTGSILDGKVYVIGGTFSEASQATAKVEAYDPVTNEWDTNIQDLPVPLCYASSNVVDGKIYVIGGKTSYSSDTLLKSVFEYDPSTNAWTSKGDMAAPRWALATAVIDDKIYAIGGGAGTNPIANDSVLMYDPFTDDWTIKANMPTARVFSSAEVIEGKIYVMGGVLFGNSISVIEAYDPQNNSWSEVGHMPEGKFLHGSAHFDGQIYIYGGGSSITPPIGSLATWKYDLVNEVFDTLSAMPESITAFASSMAEDGTGEKCLYALGGATLEFFTTGVEPLLADSGLKYCFTTTSVENIGKTSAPVLLDQNYPNPFDNSTMIKYELKNSGKVSIKIFNLDGKEVASVFEGIQLGGEHKIEWNPKTLPDGVYLYRLQTDDYVETKRCVLKN